MTTPRLVATCWTSAGAALPGAADQTSPYPVLDRVRAVAAAGWSGLGLVHDDLRLARDTIGFAALRDAIGDAGLTHVEVELAEGWWRPGGRGERWTLLLDAAEALGATFIKAGTDMGPPIDDLGPLVTPLRALAVEAADRGTRVALEPLPFSMIETVPRGAELVELVGHPAAGLVIDFWHVFRAGTSLEDLTATMPPERVFGVELCDAEAEPIGTLFEDTRDRRRLLGEGVQDVTGFIGAMRSLGFDGPWGVEILSDAHRALPLDAALRSTYASGVHAFERVPD